MLSNVKQQVVQLQWAAVSPCTRCQVPLVQIEEEIKTRYEGELSEMEFV